MQPFQHSGSTLIALHKVNVPQTSKFEDDIARVNNQRELLLNQKYKTKQSMKQILKKSQQKLTQLLEKKKE